jgi:hypothetical protein
MIFPYPVDLSSWQSEEEKYRCKRNVFKRLKKYRILRNLEKCLKLQETDLQKYLDNWESKPPEPTYVSVGPSAGSNPGLLGTNYYV